MDTNELIKDMPRDIAIIVFDTLKECKTYGLERSEIIRKICENDELSNDEKKTVIGVYKYVMDIIHY